MDCMKKPIIFCVALVSVTVGCAASFAGGREVNFKRHGLPMLKQSSALADILENDFAVEDRGLLGPSDVPFDGGRLYTYMDFKARSREGDGQVFLIRFHFDRSEKPVNYSRATLVRMEVFPVTASSEIELKTFRDLYEVTGANEPAELTADDSESP
ncbi:MAG: hypothetical protein CMO55_12615 [Verrucomicrobiales bacterium]|nr:hypothetical protein [Verrucomicrobiales bacterium]